MKKLLATMAVTAGLLSASAASAAVNLVVNGDFSAGNTGFTSGYTFVPYPGSMTAEGTYTVGPDPLATHPSWISIPDSNNRLIVNGATNPPLPYVWREDIASVASGTYDFSLQAANICCNSSYSGPNLPSLLTFEFSSNGGATYNPLAAILTSPPGDAGFFYTQSGSFFLPTAGTLRLNISSDISAFGGNDFAIDNISVTSVPEPATWAMMLMGFAGLGALLRSRRRVAMAAA